MSLLRPHKQYMMVPSHQLENDCHMIHILTQALLQTKGRETEPVEAGCASITPAYIF